MERFSLGSIPAKNPLKSPVLPILLFLVIFPSGAFAVNQLLALHGRVNQSGSGISSGDLRAFIYDANVGGTLIYDSLSDFNSTIVKGAFDVMLGSRTVGLDLNYGQRYFLDLRVNSTDLNFGSFDMKEFEASRGSVRSSSITDSTIVNADISSSASIDWSKVSKSGSVLTDLGWNSDFNKAYYAQADANNVLVNKVDANATYARRAVDENISGRWAFTGSSTLFNGGFGSGGITLQNGVLYSQGIVVVRDINAATVTAIDINGNYKPFLDNQYSLGSASNRWAALYTVDLNAYTSTITSLTLKSPLGVASGGTGNTSFSSGYIPFSNGTTLTGDGNLFWDNTNKRLGLGPNVAPQNTFNVIGDFNVARTSSGVPTIVATSSGTVGIALVSPSTTLDVNGTFRATSASGTLGLYQDTFGNVGIGTSTPGNKLNVVGDLNVTGVSYLGNVRLALSDVNVTNVNARTTDIIFNTAAGVEIARLTSAGRLGVGTTTPANMVNIAGDLNVTGTSYLGNVILQISDVNSNSITSRDGNIVFRDSVLEEVMRIVGDTNRVGIGTQNPKQALNVVGDFNVTGTSYLGDVRIIGDDINVNTVNTRDGNITFVDTTGAERARIVGSSGFVGIGTANPGQALNVVGDFNVTGTSYLGNVRLNTSDINVTNVNARDQNIVFNSAAGSELARIVGGGATSGNIGIGIAMPAGFLHLNNDANTSALSVIVDGNRNNDSAISQLVFQNNADDVASIIVQRSGANDAAELRFGTQATGGGLTTRMTIAPDGNIGLGSSNPQKRLEVVGDLNVTGSIFQGGNLISGAWIVSGSNIYNGNSGNVGIGTSTTPNNKLNVVGDVNFQSFNGSGNAFRVDSNTSGSQVSFVVDKNGQVGVGTATPQNRLNIVGDLNVTGVSYLGNIVLQTNDINVTNINPRDQNIIFRNTSGGEIARVVGAGAASGNVGIGTATPAGILDINAANNRIVVSAADGNIAIGSISVTAGYKADIAGNVRVTGDLNVGRKITVTDLNVLGAAYVGNLQLTTSDINVTNINARTSQIAFNSSTGAERMRITSDGNVGIGTVAPGGLLHVSNSGGASLTLFRVDANSLNSGGYGSVVINSSGTYTSSLVGININPPAYSLDVNGTLRVNSNSGSTGLFQGSDSNVTVGGVFGKSKLNVLGDVNFTSGAGTGTPYFYLRSTDGNVGLGSTNPQKKLEVVGDLNVTGSIFQGGNLISGAWIVSGSNIYNGNSGNVGIGTSTSPANKLNVVGDLNVVTSATAVPSLLVGSSDGNVSVANRFGTNRLTVVGDVNVTPAGTGSPSLFVRPTDGNVGLGTSSPVSTLGVVGDVNVSGSSNLNGLFVKGNVGVNTVLPNNKLNVVGDLNVSVSATSSQPSLFVGSDGNVGVGWGVPSRRFVVRYDNAGSGVANSVLYNADTAVNNSVGLSLRSDSNSASTFFEFGLVDLLVSDHNAPKGSLRFFTAGSSAGVVERLRIGSDGNVGLGLAVNPVSKLNVVGDVNFALAAGTGAPSLYVRGSDGNIGLGSSNPQKKLEVVGDLNVTGSIFQGGNLISGAWIVSGSNIYNGNSGNVGIGTSTTPNNKLNVVGDVNFQYFNGSGSAFRVDANTSTSIVTGLLVDRNGNVGVNTSTPQNRLNVVGDFNVSPSGLSAPALFARQSDGNVGIGTSSPGATLDVAGDIKGSGTTSKVILGTNISMSRTSDGDLVIST